MCRRDKLIVASCLTSLGAITRLANVIVKDSIGRIVKDMSMNATTIISSLKLVSSECKRVTKTNNRKGKPIH